MSDPDDDRLLVEQVRQGRIEAYDSLVERYGDRIYNMLVHLVNGDGELAAEYTQEAFVRAFERLDRFSGESTFYTWLYRLARNRAIDLLARKKPTSMDLQGLQQQDRRPQRDTDQLERNEAQQHVQEALGRLSEEQRELILMRDFDGQDYASIAAVLAVPEGTVKSRLNRARRALREELAPIYAEAGL